MKYMILTFASQQHYQEMAGQASSESPWAQEDWAALGQFMQAFNQELLDSGELVETRGLSAPVHTRRIQLKEESRWSLTAPTPRPRRCSPGTG